MLRSLVGSEMCIRDSDSIDGDDGVIESVVLAFDEPFDIRSISFRDGNHDVISGDETILFNVAFGEGIETLIEAWDNPEQVWTISEILALASSGALDGATAVFFGFGGPNAVDFYVEAISDIPVPGALPLLISGIAGLGFASRRRKSAK